ncbi:MAG: PspC domain-containing protein [Candidatus Dormiibacterota bacterium]
MQAPAGERFYRGRGRIIGGVCCGIAARFHVDTLWVRIAFVVLAFAQGIGLVIYALLWLVMPEAPDGEGRGLSGFDAVTADLDRMWAEVRGRPAPGVPAAPARDRSMLLGGILLVIGLVLLGNNTGFVSWSVLWPVILIAIGAFVLLRNSRREP